MIMSSVDVVQIAFNIGNRNKYAGYRWFNDGNKDWSGWVDL